MKPALLLLATAFLAGPAYADQALATARNCMTCHAVDKDVLGPSFRKIATKYANDKGAADRLAVKIIKGGGGVWGTAVMPANQQVTESEAKKLALWALSQK
jgi:cytochrome c